MTRTKWARRVVAIAAASVLGITTMSGAAIADLVRNTISTVDANTVSLAGPAATASVGLRLQVEGAGADGIGGCNLKDLTDGYVKISLTSSAPGVATVMPTTITFTDCNIDVPVTVTGVGAGTATIEVKVTDTNAKGINENADFTVVVAGPTNTAPQITITGVEDGASYPKGSVPAAVCEVTDAEDGDSAFPAELSDVTGPYAADGIGQQTATCSYTDGGGLSVTETATYSIVDPSAPVISPTLDPSAPDGFNGWYVSDVTLTWTVTEDESPSSLTTAGCDGVTVTADQQATDYTCTAGSAGGSSSETVTIKRDATAPVVNLVGGPTGTYYYGDPLPAAPTCEASDATSGLDGECSVTGPDDGTAVGTHTYTATATDNAGNRTTVEQSYEVLAWTTSGFYKPVNMGDVWNTVKGGSTVPLKFELFAGDRELTSTSAIDGFAVKTISCTADGTGVEDAVDFTTTGGTVLRYDDKDGQFIQNWQTPKKAGSCYKVTMTAKDGSTISAKFKLK